MPQQSPKINKSAENDIFDNSHHVSPFIKTEYHRNRYTVPCAAGRTDASDVRSSDFPIPEHAPRNTDTRDTSPRILDTPSLSAENTGNRTTPAGPSAAEGIPPCTDGIQTAE